MSELLCKIESLAIFKGIRETEPLRSFCEFLRIADNVSETRYDVLAKYTVFVNELYKVRNDGDLAYAIWIALKNDHNPYLDAHIRRQISLMRTGEDVRISHLLKNGADKELKLIQEIATTSYAEVEKLLAYDGYVAQFKTTGIDITERYTKMLEGLAKLGYGMFMDHVMFRFSDGSLEPVLYPDEVKIDNLFGYERKRALVVNNTKKFIKGSGEAVDMLLYGDNGTGKSSTIKAVANLFADKGIRLVELPIGYIEELPALVDMLSCIPLRFIIFFDDMSFNAGDERIGYIRSILEGSASAKRYNILIYAACNSRYMLRQPYEGEEPETDPIGLSDRFGLKVLFDRPNKAEYINICRKMVEARGMTISDDEAFENDCEQYALGTGGRSVRTARQFADRYES